MSSRRTSPSSAAPCRSATRANSPLPAPGIEDVEVEDAEDAEDDDAVLADADDLEDDADAIGPEIDVETDNDEADR